MAKSAGHPQAEGFSLLETMVATAITAIALTTVIAFSARLVAGVSLRSTATLLLERMRYAQNLSATSGTSAIVWLDPFDSNYHIIYGTNNIGAYAYAGAVHYVDGYLQLPRRYIAYDNLGNSQVAGEVMLTDGPDVAEIDLYMGVGFQKAGWTSS